MGRRGDRKPFPMSALRVCSGERRIIFWPQKLLLLFPSKHAIGHYKLTKAPTPNAACRTEDQKHPYLSNANDACPRMCPPPRPSHHDSRGPISLENGSLEALLSGPNCNLYSACCRTPQYQRLIEGSTLCPHRHWARVLDAPFSHCCVVNYLLTNWGWGP